MNGASTHLAPPIEELPVGVVEGGGGAIVFLGHRDPLTQALPLSTGIHSLHRLHWMLVTDL